MKAFKKHQEMAGYLLPQSENKFDLSDPRMARLNRSELEPGISGSFTTILTTVFTDSSLQNSINQESKLFCKFLLSLVKDSSEIETKIENEKTVRIKQKLTALHKSLAHNFPAPLSSRVIPAKAGIQSSSLPLRLSAFVSFVFNPNLPVLSKRNRP